MNKNNKEGSLRRLTSGEIWLAREIFKDTISYYKVWIHHDSYLPFGLQNKNTAMAPNGELYFRNWYSPDFSNEDFTYQYVFIHEMSHVWQREHGMNIIVRGLISWAVSYRYTLDGRSLGSYPMEQQAQIIADYFLLEFYGYGIWFNSRLNNTVTLDGDISETVIRKHYKNALRNFPWSL
jgi:hypothetical protein